MTCKYKIYNKLCLDDICENLLFNLNNVWQEQKVTNSASGAKFYKLKINNEVYFAKVFSWVHNENPFILKRNKQYISFTDEINGLRYLSDYINNKNNTLSQLTKVYIPKFFVSDPPCMVDNICYGIIISELADGVLSNIVSLVHKKKLNGDMTQEDIDEMLFDITLSTVEYIEFFNKYIKICHGDTHLGNIFFKDTWDIHNYMTIYLSDFDNAYVSKEEGADCAGLLYRFDDLGNFLYIWLQTLRNENEDLQHAINDSIDVLDDIFQYEDKQVFNKIKEIIKNKKQEYKDSLVSNMKRKYSENDTRYSKKKKE